MCHPNCEELLSVFVKMIVEVISHQGAEDRGDCPEADRTGREINTIHILRPRGIRLDTAVLTKGFQLFLGEKAAEKLDGMKHG